MPFETCAVNGDPSRKERERPGGLCNEKVGQTEDRYIGEAVEENVVGAGECLGGLRERRREGAHSFS